MVRHPPVKAKCAACGKTFVRHVCHIRQSRRVFCSVECYRAGAIIVKKCLQCGGEFSVAASKVRKGSGKFCSRKCYGRWQSKNMRGHSSYLWRGGRTKLQSLIRNSAEYARWRDKVILKSGGKCSRCGAVGGQAHHLKPFSMMIMEACLDNPHMIVRDAAMSHPKMMDVRNGVCLCARCHRAEHRYKKCP
jgi:hypothetical protein